LKLKRYKKDLDYSYALGAFPTWELLDTHPQQVRRVLLHPRFNGDGALENKCQVLGIPAEYSEKAFNLLSDKENCYVICIYEKYSQTINAQRNHLILDTPSDRGNMGTVIRTAVGFGIRDIAIIGSGVDVCHPKVLRASMGAAFRLSAEYFPTFAAYWEKVGGPTRTCYPFMLDGARELSSLRQTNEPYSLIFGNEATGLPQEYNLVGTSLAIRHAHEIDSLNLPIAVAIALYHFSTLGGNGINSQKAARDPH